MYWMIAILLFIIAIVYASIVRVPDVYIGLPSSLIRGRLKRELDKDGYSVPIREAYKEGFHIKWPWWRVLYLSREVVTRKVPPKKFQVKGSEKKKKQLGGHGGGSVSINITLQYRTSRVCAYRFVEVDADALKAGLDAEIDYEIGKQLGDISDYEKAITLRPILSEALYKRFNNTVVERNEKGDIKENGKPRKIGKKDVTYAEHNYGIEVLKVSIDSIDVPEDLDKARQEKQKELYERESQTTEWEHLMGKLEQLKKILPGLEEKEALRAVQVWQEQFPYEVKEIKIDSPDSLAGLAATFAAILGNKTSEKLPKPKKKGEK